MASIHKVPYDFDVKMKDVQRKAIMVAGGHINDAS